MTWFAHGWMWMIPIDELNWWNFFFLGITECHCNISTPSITVWNSTLGWVRIAPLALRWHHSCDHKIRVDCLQSLEPDQSNWGYCLWPWSQDHHCCVQLLWPTARPKASRVIGNDISIFIETWTRIIVSDFLALLEKTPLGPGLLPYFNFCSSSKEA
jgi:hypothetical protein